MLKINDKYTFSYCSIGEFCSDTSWIHPDRIIDSYELIMVTKGAVHIQEEDTKYSIEKNECIILEPEKRHLGWKASTLSTSFYWFHFNTNLEIPFKVYTGDEYYDIRYLLKKLLHMSKTPFYASSALDSAGLLLFSELSATSVVSESSLFNKIAEYVRINAHKGISVETISQHFGYSTDHISRLFKKNFGIGLKKYIMSERIKCARDLLLNTDLSVKEISAQLGFSDSNHFIKFFIYHEEITPTQLRNKYFNTHMNNK